MKCPHAFGPYWACPICNVVMDGPGSCWEHTSEGVAELRPGIDECLRCERDRLAGELAEERRKLAICELDLETARDDHATQLREVETERDDNAINATMDIEGLRADLRAARRLMVRVFATTKHFKECACVTCEDARAFIAGVASRPAPLPPQRPPCKLDVDECAEDNGGEPCSAHDDALWEPVAAPPQPEAADAECFECAGDGLEDPDNTDAPCKSCGGTGRAPEASNPMKETDMKTIDGIPRRNRLDHNVPAELAIRAAVDAVEKLGASPVLTDAVNLLGQALAKVADFVDGATPKP